MITKERAVSLVEKSHAYGSRTRQVRSAMRRRRYCYMAIGIGTLIVSLIQVFVADLIQEFFSFVTGGNLNPTLFHLRHYLRFVLMNTKDDPAIAPLSSNLY